MASAAKTTGTSSGPGDRASNAKKSKSFMRDPERIEMVKTHRALLSTIGSTGGPVCVLRFSASKSEEKEPEFGKIVPRYFKPIKLRQMDPEQEWVFLKRVLYLTLIEDPMTGFTPIHLIAKDETGQATRVFVHEVPHTPKMLEKFCYGQQLAIIHPYMRIALDGRHGIRVDDPGTIVFLGKATNMCRYCGKENAPHNCARCKRNYCSRECQVSDWNEFDHKRICKKLR